MESLSINRRQMGYASLALAIPGLSGATDPSGLRLGQFSAEINPPVGHPCMGGGISPVVSYLDPLFAKGIVLIAKGHAPVVIVSADWCEIRHTAHDAWRKALADATGTTPERVLVSSVHQHDAPVADLRAEEILKKAGSKGSVCFADFHAVAVARVARAAKIAIGNLKTVDKICASRIPVQDVSSNRRTLDSKGRIRFDRGSTTRDAELRQGETGVIDPDMAMISLESSGQALAALFCYATHPMSQYGKGAVSADFPGLARRMVEQAHPGLQAIYLSGCSGNVTAGKYNDGAPGNRMLLAGRLAEAMTKALATAKPLKNPGFRFASVPYSLAFRNTLGFDTASLEAKLHAPRSFDQCLAAMGLSCQERLQRPLDLPILDFGGAALLLAPGESYVEYQLYAKSLRPEAVVLCAGYGESVTGYVPTEKAWAEKDSNLGDWCWVAPGSEDPLKVALKTALLNPVPK